MTSFFPWEFPFGFPGLPSAPTAGCGPLLNQHSATDPLRCLWLWSFFWGGFFLQLGLDRRWRLFTYTLSCLRACVAQRRHGKNNGSPCFRAPSGKIYTRRAKLPICERGSEPGRRRSRSLQDPLTPQPLTTVYEVLYHILQALTNVSYQYRLTGMSLHTCP